MTSPTVVATDVPFRLNRLGVIMSPEIGSEFEADGVCNPGSGRTEDGRLWLLPRLVAKGNVSRVGLAEVEIRDDLPIGVRRHGPVLAADTGWERAHDHEGVEDPRVTWIPRLGVHVMAYVAFGPLGPRPAIAVSKDLRTWKRLGPLHFDYQDDLDTDLNLFTNKDVVFFPEPVPGPDGRSWYAVLHRPTWDLGVVLGRSDIYLPAGIDDSRGAIWISYIDFDRANEDVHVLTRAQHHKLLVTPEYGFEALKIGAGPPPRRVDEGWLLIHHGVSGTMSEGWGAQPNLRYCAGAILLAGDDPSHLLARTAHPLLAPETIHEREGTVPNVVFPTAIEEIAGRLFVFYGMADTSIGVASLDRVPNPDSSIDDPIMQEIRREG